MGEDSDLDVEGVADHIDTIPSSELVYVDVFPDGSPCCVASEGLPSFSQSPLRHPLIQRGVARLDSIASDGVSAPSVSSSSGYVPDAVDQYMKGIPLMLVFKGNVPEYREFHFILGAIEACVARLVSKKERLENPDARASLAKEWNRLRKINTWNEDLVREWSDVAADARQSGTKVHVGRIFDICVERGSELQRGDPARKYKGRVVFQGNNVRDENWEVAMFQDLSSCPATMEAGKACDLYGSLEGHEIQQSDAELAYTQSRLGGDPTWVRLPREQWPESWKGMRDPVCPLILALYRHPDAGGYWEAHCESHLKSVGFVPIEEWRSCFWHSEWKRENVLGRLCRRFQACWPQVAHERVMGCHPSRHKD